MSGVSNPPVVPGPDYCNRAILVSALVVIAAVVFFYFTRAKWVELKRYKATFHYFFEGAEWVLAIVISIVGTFFELYKPTTWQQPKPSLVGSASVLTGLVVCYLGVKGVSAAAKKQDSEEIEKLKGEKTKLQEEGKRLEQKVETVEEQRDKISEAAMYVGKTVELRKDKMLDCLKKGGPPEAKRILEALDPKEHINVIVRTMFHYIERGKAPDKSLRLGLYAKDQSDPRYLERIYAWDGKGSECFRRDGKALGAIDDPDGVPTKILELYHSNSRIIVLESCAEAEKKGKFRYWPGQETYLKSMVLYKHLGQRDGTTSAMILTLDSSQEGLFKEKDAGELEFFLREMLKRVDLELVFIEALNGKT